MRFTHTSLPVRPGLFSVNQTTCRFARKPAVARSNRTAPLRRRSRTAVNQTTKEVSQLPKVVARNNESPEQLMRRFRKEVMKSRVLADVRRKRWFLPKSEVKRIKQKKALRRNRRSQHTGS